MRSLTALWMLSGCGGRTEGSVVVSGYAFLYNDSDTAIDVLGERFAQVDCFLLDHPGLGVTLRAQAPETLTLEPRVPYAPWDLDLFVGEFDPSCLVAQVTTDDRVATMTYDLRLPYQDQWLPVGLQDLTHNTLVITPDAEPRFQDGGQGALAREEDLPPLCETSSNPSWTGQSSTGTLLALTTEGACTTLVLSGEGNDIVLCNGPPLPYVVDEDLEIEVSDTHLSIATASGGKPVLLATAVEHLPSYLSLVVESEEPDRTVLPADTCRIDTPCGSTMSIVPRFQNANLLGTDTWDSPHEVRTPDGALRHLTVHQVGVPADRSCPLAASFTLVPVAPSAD